ncbi:hypothetical protein KEM56_002137 [Ascosphaera pollenicola]|nr:hypothetical protein KEM56_002137 [Ascosphaera pollenicola]
MTRPSVPQVYQSQPVQPIQVVVDQPPRMSLIRRAAEYPPQDENGRKYHGFHRGIYMFPCDEQEMERLDFLHNLITMARSRCLHEYPIQTPVDQNGLPIMRPIARILDLGCGTGIWALKMAERYPSCAILGVDLAGMQPEKVPPNVEFLPHRDFEDPWFLGEDSWDMVRLSMGSGSVKSWENLYRKVHAHLRPETGYFEQVEIDFEPRWDSEDRGHPGVTPDEPLGFWWSELKRATRLAERPIAHNLNTEHMLKAAGFMNVEHRMIGLPLNPWPLVPREADLGRIYNLAFCDSLYALALAPLCRVLGYTPERVAHLAEHAYRQACDERCKAFNIIHIYTARKKPANA